MLNNLLTYLDNIFIITILIETDKTSEVFDTIGKLLIMTIIFHLVKAKL